MSEPSPTLDIERGRAGIVPKPEDQYMARATDQAQRIYDLTHALNQELRNAESLGLCVEIVQNIRGTSPDQTFRLNMQVRIPLKPFIFRANQHLDA